MTYKSLIYFRLDSSIYDRLSAEMMAIDWTIFIYLFIFFLERITRFDRNATKKIPFMDV